MPDNYISVCARRPFFIDDPSRWIGLTFTIDYDDGYIAYLNSVPIETAEDFDTWVLGAMAELSDSGTPPPEVTYQKIVDLARQIRDH